MVLRIEKFIMNNENFITASYVASSFGLCQLLLSPALITKFIADKILNRRFINLVSKHYDPSDPLIKNCFKGRIIRPLNKLNEQENKKLIRLQNQKNVITLIFLILAVGSIPVIGPLKALASIDIGPLKPKKHLQKS